MIENWDVIIIHGMLFINVGQTTEPRYYFKDFVFYEDYYNEQAACYWMVLE